MWGCEKSTGPSTSAQPPLAGLRYFDAVVDTSYMDFRVVDIVQFAPNAVRAVFRSGGDPSGTTNGFLSPPYLPVQTGAHDIRVFLDSNCTTACSSLGTDTTVMFDTTVTFAQGHNYTFILYGSARAKTLHSLVLDDQNMALPADNGVWVRTINLATGIDTTGLGPSVDAYVIAQSASPATPPTFAGATNLFGKATAYVRVPVGSLQAVLTRAGTVAPLTLSLTSAATGTGSNFPAGVVGTSTVQVVAGSLVKNTAFSVIILPRTAQPMTGNPSAARFANPGAYIMIDQQPPLTAP
ncbi:MAG TPA: DUF4397 domain-containing protein [Gemmatimonadales bacterium]|nr:DUF4397 domain-containing protein [Gemmatimonadales bacterium]